jgi:hypothetical protein
MFIYAGAHFIAKLAFVLAFVVVDISLIRISAARLAQDTNDLAGRRDK